MKKIAILSLALIAICHSLSAQTPRISVKVPRLYPEGIAFDELNKIFFISSVKTGTIGTLNQNGDYKEFYKNKDLIASFGMKVDVKNNRLIVCLSDPNPNYSMYSSPQTLKKMGRIIALDLKTQKKIMDVDLAKLYPGNHFINDLTLDPSGNIYATDSFSPVIYRIDSKGGASVFAQHEWFSSVDIGLNGIAYHPSGFLIAVNNSNGSILKIDLADPKKNQPSQNR